MAGQDIISTEPATGAFLWRRAADDVDTEVARARESWPAWASQPLAFRIETLRRFANVVRQRLDAFTDLIARETGKPLWDARTEVEAVIAKVQAAGVRVHRIGTTGGNVIAIAGERAMTVAALAARFEGWFPTYMAGKPGSA